ncbi:uncharacterized protein LOC105185069 [Harpegnathos saltator]|uniref:uncharacterized protein LOC105185069 n=1 Tax=Harpegnathos saltator TaxID=610380 RepID=UPI000DBEEABA|nr:uncharacterized protein LOC105185069 [Harpegnathos saltator]
MDITKTLFPYSGPWESVHYNKIFHPNLCHVCKKTREVVNLITCNQCFLISYCSEDHKNLHLPQHREICTVIEKFLKINPQYLTRRFSLKEWLKAQNEFYQSVQKDVGRALENYETEIFVFARSCIICYQQTGLYSCKRCLSIDYCLEHKEDFEQKHTQMSCDYLILWLNLELSNVQYESADLLSSKFMKFPDDNRPFHDMATFIEEYVQNEKGVWYALDYIYSDYVSGPLSIYYGMHQARLIDILLDKSTYIIHVIAASYIERNSLPAWEILLHLLPNIEVLIVVLIGINLQFEFGIQDICPNCVCNKKKFIYECCGMLYTDYMGNPMYGRADLIVGLESLFDFESLMGYLKTMQSQDCPVLLFTTLLETEEIDKIQVVLGRDVYPVISMRNEFESQRPYRFFKYIIYRNSYLILYKTLKNTNYTTENSS